MCESTENGHTCGQLVYKVYIILFGRCCEQMSGEVKLPQVGEQDVESTTNCPREGRYDMVDTELPCNQSGVV